MRENTNYFYQEIQTYYNTCVECYNIYSIYLRPSFDINRGLLSSPILLVMNVLECTQLSVLLLLLISFQDTQSLLV